MDNNHLTKGKPVIVYYLGIPMKGIYLGKNKFRVTTPTGMTLVLHMDEITSWRDMTEDDLDSERFWG